MRIMMNIFHTLILEDKDHFIVTKLFFCFTFSADDNQLKARKWRESWSKTSLIFHSTKIIKATSRFF